MGRLQGWPSAGAAGMGHRLPDPGRGSRASG